MPYKSGYSIRYKPEDRRKRRLADAGDYGRYVVPAAKTVADLLYAYQAFAQGTPNAYATLDGLLAARQLLDKMGFDYGPLLFNVGYSSGGYDALIVQKVRDKEYADQVSFDKTFAGGSPSDICEAYRQYVILDETAYNAVPLLIMVCTKETQMLNIDYKDVFQPYICDRIDELILSKQYSSWPVCDSIGREKKIHEILSPTYCNLDSPESQFMQQL